MTPRIAVLGSSNTDMIVRLQALPKPGETVIGGTFAMAGGGKGANQAVAAARAGGSVTFISRVGNDTFGRQSIDSFSKEGIEISHIGMDERAASGIALILIDHSGENMIGVASGANAAMSPESIESALEVVGASGLFLTQLEIPLSVVERAIHRAHEAKVPVVLDPAPAQKLRADILAKVGVLTPNESEARSLAGMSNNEASDVRAIAERLLATGVGAVVITLGARGAYVADRERSEHIPAFDVQAVDTTAAGDVFNGALAVALSERAHLREAAIFASAAAAISVTRLGAQPSAPRRSEIESFLRERQ